jgi:glycosyltransferase involved in cell wall biosynthesis
MSGSIHDHPVLSVIIPVYGEGYHLKEVLSAVKRNVEGLDEAYEMILVDDGSEDDTWQIIEEESKNLPMLRALRLSRNFGKEAAISAGLEIARGRAVILIDGDLQHPPELIPEMVRCWRDSGVDVVEAVKESRGPESLVNKIGSRIFYLLLSRLSGYDLRGASDYKLMDRRVVNAWLAMKERNLFFRGMVAWLGFKRVQLPFSVQERRGGESRWSLFLLIKLAINAVSGFSSIMLQVITLFGGFFLLFALYLGSKALYMKITGQAVTGFTTVILLQLIIGSLLMISLGIIGIYLAKIYDEVKARPRYIVAEAINGSTASAEPSSS